MIRRAGRSGLAQRLGRAEPGNFVLLDAPARGGDGTYYTGNVNAELWSEDLGQAMPLSADQLRDALEDCDNACLYRARFEFVEVCNAET